MTQSGSPPVSALRRFWSKHRAAFWTLHSVWALATGVAVIVLARERYGFVPWVVLFLVLTWASTLYFNRKLKLDPEGSAGPGLRTEATSYLARAMYQETMFFLLPFYAYSTVIGSPNALFTGGLAGLAILSCLDLLFDRWLRTNVVVSLLFFAVVSFAALNLLLPMLVPIDPAWATRLAAAAALAGSVPLALQSPRSGRERVYLGVAGVAFLGVTLGAPQLVPAVPLRLESPAFSSNIDRGTLAIPDTLGPRVPAEDLDGLLVFRTEVFAPAIVPTRVSLQWELDGEVIRASRDIEIVAHDLGFRLWDSWRPPEGRIPPGSYRVLLRASGNRVFGAAELSVGDPPKT
jgi:hypothetical protein